MKLESRLDDVVPKGGMFSGKILSENDMVESGSRFDASGRQGQMYRERYFRTTFFEALKKIKGVAVSSGLEHAIAGE